MCFIFVLFWVEIEGEKVRFGLWVGIFFKLEGEGFSLGTVLVRGFGGLVEFGILRYGICF